MKKQQVDYKDYDNLPRYECMTFGAVIRKPKKGKKKDKRRKSYHKTRS